MKKLLFPLFLACLLMPSSLPAHGHDHDETGASASVAACDCPSDCHCRQPGGTCPEEGPCSPDCDCDKGIDGRGIWVHPSMREAIEANTNEGDKMASGLKTAAGPVSSESDFIFVNGVKQYTGFKPTWEMYRGAKFVKISPWEGRGIAQLPKNFSLRGMSPVRGQECGDCWAQATISCFEANVNSSLGAVLRIFSVQDVIDNSGQGSCGGGNLAGSHLAKGAALESEYPYLHGRNGRKRTDVTRYEKNVGYDFLRGSEGGLPTLQEIQLSLVEWGALGVCGSASSLGNGGRQDTIRGGGTNHCYALTGYVDGKERGWLDAVYLEIKNSWGDGDSSNPLSNGRSWGDKGYGYYPLAKGDGTHLKGSVITEIQLAQYKPMKPPEPIVFQMRSKFATWNITIKPPFDGWNQVLLTKELTDALANVEVAQ